MTLEELAASLATFSIKNRSKKENQNKFARIIVKV